MDAKNISKDVVEEIIECIQEFKNIDDFCKSVSIEEVKNNNYNLNPKSYFEVKIEIPESRSYEEIVKEINRIIKDKNTLKLTINETLAKNIGLKEIYDLSQESKEANKCFNSFLNFLNVNVQIENNDYISLTKNKNEIKFENNNKEKVSDILLTIFQMWKANIHYLNNEENRYLAELRDKLLPELMSGKIDVGDWNFEESE